MSLRALLLSAVLAGALAAHSPHDVVKAIGLSPAFATDGRAIAVLQLTEHFLLGLTDDGGRSWTILGGPMLGKDVNGVVFATEQVVFAPTGQAGLWRSTDGGLTWAPSDAGLTATTVKAVAVSPAFASDGVALAATTAGCFRTADGGDTWTPADTGLTETSLSAVAFAPDGQTAFCAGLVAHRSDDGGRSWTPMAPLPALAAAVSVSPAFAEDDTVAISFGRFGNGVSISTDGGLAWGRALDGLTDLFVNDVTIAADGTMFAVTESQACFRAAAPFAPWTLFDQGFETPSDLTTNHYADLELSPAFDTDDTLFVASFEGLFESNDRGETWQQSDLYSLRFVRRFALAPAYADGGLMFAGSYGGGVYVANDGGSPEPALGGQSLAKGGAGGVRAAFAPPLTDLPWEARSTDINSLYTESLLLSPDYSNDRTVFYGHSKFYRSTNAGRDWTEVPLPQGVTLTRALGISPAFDVDQTLLLGTSKQGTWRSTDAGDSWVAADGGLPGDTRAGHVRFSPTYLFDRTVFQSTKNYGVWRSTDRGDTWTQLDNGVNENVRALAVSPRFFADGTVAAGTVGDGLFLSTDKGDTWQPANAGMPATSDLVIEDVVFSPRFDVDDTMLLSTRDDGLFRSVDAGATWEPIGEGLPLGVPRGLLLSPAFDEDGIAFLATYDWMYRSFDRGDTWERLNGFARVDDVHPTALYSVTGWLGALEPGSYGPGITANDDAGAWTELEFHGDSVRWFATRHDAAPIVDVVLDGEVVATVDLYAPATEPGSLAYEVEFGEADWHVLRIVHTGTTNPSALGAELRSDGFSYTF